jgi:hypothetical protein
MRCSGFQILLLFAAALASTNALAGGLRIALLADTGVQGDTILLANLLPGNAPGALRTAAEAITLGAAPHSGTVRRFSRDAILAALQSHSLSPSSFQIPEVVTVHRGGRLLTQQEAFAAIDTVLAKNQIAESPKFTLGDLAFNAAVTVPSGDPQLEVTQITFDEAIGRARFRLRSHAAPGVNAFYVTARVSPEISAAASPIAGRVLAGMFAKTRSPVDSPVLVDPRQYARLHMRSTNADMQLAVKPLQRGRLGETIRVRCPASGKTWQARVVGKDSLDATF